MEVRELEWFVVLARTENVTNAATQLHVSQPTLSRALARIERQLGVKLFDRNQNRLRLNKYGEIYRAHAVRAMRELTQGEERIRTLVDPERGVVSLGFLHSFGSWLIPSLLDKYHVASPLTTFELEGGAADAIVEAVRSGRIDVGFVAPRPVAEDLAWVPLGRELLCLEVPQNDEFAARDFISIAEIATRPMITLGPSYGLRHVVDRLFDDAGVTPIISIEATELSTLRALVRHGSGIAIVPVPPAGQESPTVTIPIIDANAFRFYGAVTRNHGPTGSAAKAFLEYVSGHFATADVEVDA
ncbi:LysR family transcriptional regulator [Rhodococcus sp. BP-149]|uniref:LysR family transcriptional regulator n=1 Tax=unclassified Rhodococcus (in: high G+C Gram-positive bacteria) TaxID=192944 RepID=UPI001C9B2AFC|nr:MULTISPECIES: LysR family transcriptional regulator [unclassified Rhodococcus (in: high G+C Gram-positive bacteria)]MBY6685596.1 LysR family transcriptional regulator [Rhodococcus sp. BP-288]MBY6694856.1 LysR family transcriptional regulator [Rhodococcus sp. BP-188]MBY6696702.1 LysR family transcriptional regulator [Rhodococcus sp. BP-285]MBY6703358.1 LysR family transcriptional regulator [Rhodococcus sp. BP-283]MBY6708681.1 LysR family transcriptional regulator [Rhodococcus sp. BP-241]